jgi:hypothetical protein
MEDGIEFREPVCQECVCAICSNEDAEAKEDSDGVNRRVDGRSGIVQFSVANERSNCIQNVE